MRRMRLLADERGITLVMVLIIMIVLLVTATSATYFSTSNSNSAVHQVREVSAYALGEAGINNAVAVIANVSNPTVSTLLPARTSTYGTGTVTWSGTYDSSAKEWTVTAVGRVTDTLGTARKVEKRLTAKIPLTPATTQTANLPAWNYVYATGSSQSCDLQLYNSVTLAAPVYVVGDACLYNTATIVGSSTVVNVTGRAYMTQPGNSIGLNGSGLIAAAHIVNGCQLQGNPVHIPCRGQDHLYANTADTTLNPSTLAPPAVNWDYWYQNASPGPKAPCQTKTGTPPAFDTGDGVRNASISAPVNLTPTSSYTCVTKFGQLSWNHSTKALTISGSVFVDGSVYLDSAGSVNYSGQASLFTSGTFLLKTTQLCAVVGSGACNGASWNPNSRYLVVAANALNYGGATMQTLGITLQNSDFQGALYSPAGIDAAQGSDINGGVVGSYISLGQKATITAATTVPAGMPGNTVTTYTVGTPYSYSG